MIGDVLLIAAFVVGALTGNALLVLYGLRSRWRETRTGRVLISLFAVVAVSYDLTVAAVMFPHVFDGGIGLWIRVVGRLAIDGVLIGLLVLLVAAQRRDRGVVRTVEVFTPPEDVRQPSTE